MASSADQSSKGVRKRMSSPEADASTKRIRSEDGEDTESEGKGKNKSNGSGNGEEAKYNPYLAHYNDERKKGSPLRNFTRRQTTAKQAFDAEEGDNTPFTGEPHSQQYFNILKTRRNLPVHKQR